MARKDKKGKKNGANNSISSRNRYDNNKAGQDNANNLGSSGTANASYGDFYSVQNYHVDSSINDSAYFSDPDADMKIYPDGLNNQQVSSELPVIPSVAVPSPAPLPTQSVSVTGVFSTLPLTDNTQKFKKSKAPKPSDDAVKEARDWGNFNKQ